MTHYDVVITAYNQGFFIREAVDSVLCQTVQPSHIIVVDDGGDDVASCRVLEEVACHPNVTVIRQENAGVSAARNRGISEATQPYVLVFDGDDRILPLFAERTLTAMGEDPHVLGASSWVQMFGVAHAIVRPEGGEAADFLSKNRAPATVMMRREAWSAAGGYDEAMREGFEDWDFFLSILSSGGRIEIVPELLLDYRTAVQSANITSMGKRRRLYASLMDKHEEIFRQNFRRALLDLDEGRSSYIRKWENLAAQYLDAPCEEATFGDGGMAAVVRVESARLTSHSRACSLTQTGWTYTDGARQMSHQGKSWWAEGVQLFNPW